MKTLLKAIVVAAACASGLVVTSADARPVAAGGGYHGGSGYRGGYNHGGYYRGGYGYRGGYYRGGYYGGGYWGPGAFIGGLGLGLGIGALAYPAYGPYGYDDDAPVVVAGTTYVTPPVAQSAPTPSAPNPVVYPRAGQSAGQTETDRRECNQWATTQVGAMNDASVFQRASMACLEGRNYTVR